MRATWNAASKTALPLSMGPTPFSVGDTFIWDERNNFPWALQWGQRHSALETSEVREMFCSEAWLQWGQRHSALETQEDGDTHRD